MTKSLFNLKEISLARNFIYGLSILWIIFYHSGLNVSSSVFKAIKSVGDCSVEIFFFQSGISLYFSFSKDRNILSFYKRRLIRTLPYYLLFYGIVFVYFNLIENFNVLQFFLNYTMLDFWMHGLGNSPWFLAAILLFYGLYPMIYTVFFTEYKHKAIFVSLFVVIMCTLCVTLSIFCPHLRIFTYRIPIFILGCLAGKWVHDGLDFKFWNGLVLFATLIVTAVLFACFKEAGFIRNLFYIPLSLTVICVATQFYKFNLNYCKAVNKPFEFLGAFTLEIYLTHEKVQENLFKILNAIGPDVQFGNTIYQLCCILLAIGISVGLSLVIRLLIKKIQRKKRP